MNFSNETKLTTQKNLNKGKSPKNTSVKLSAAANGLRKKMYISSISPQITQLVFLREAQNGLHLQTIYYGYSLWEEKRGVQYKSMF